MINTIITMKVKCPKCNEEFDVTLKAEGKFLDNEEKFGKNYKTKKEE